MILYEVFLYVLLLIIVNMAEQIYRYLDYNRVLNAKRTRVIISTYITIFCVANIIFEILSEDPYIGYMWFVCLFTSAVFASILALIGYKKHMKLLIERVEHTLGNSDINWSTHELVKAYIRDYNTAYLHKEVEKAVKINQKDKK